MTHWFPSLSTPCSFLKNAYLLTVIPQINTFSTGNATLHGEPLSGEGWGDTFRESLRLPGFPRCFPAPQSSPLPPPRSLPAPLCLLTQLRQSCYQFTTPVRARRPMLTVKYPLFWTTRVTEKGIARGPRRKRERGFDPPTHPHFLVSTQNSILPLD